MGKLLFVLSWFASLSFADVSRSVSVSGEAETLVVPDQAVLSVAVESLDANLKKATDENQALVKKAIAAAEKNGLKSAQIQSDRVEVEPRSDSYSSHKISGYFVRRRIVLKVTDLAKLEALTLDLLAAGVNRIESTEFLTDALRKHRDDVRLLALKAAQEKALALARGAGAKLGRVLTITEDSWNYGWSGGGQSMAQNVVRNQAQDPGAGGDSMRLGKLSVRARVNASFEIQ